MSMRVLIAGAGRAGLSVAVHLQAMGHRVIVIDREEAVSKRAFEHHGLISFAGDATGAALLREAEVSRCDVVVAMLRRDADNLAVALLAQAGGAKRVMVRMRDPEYKSVYLAAGINRILSEIDVFVGALATAIEHEAVRHSMVLGSGESVAFELTIPHEAMVVGVTVSDMASYPDFPSSCVIAGMLEADGVVQAPRGSSIVTGGMTVLLVARRGDLGDAIDFFMRAK